MVGKVNKCDRRTKVTKFIQNMHEMTRKENEYLRELLVGEEMKKYLRVKELSGERVTNLSKLRDDLEKVRKELAYIE